MKLLNWDGLRAKGWPKSKAQTYRDIRAGKFPAPVYPGRSPAWTEAEIDEHFAELVRRRDSKEPEAA